MKPPFDPANDAILQNLKHIALRGGERGPLYDLGVATVVGQIEKDRCLVVNPIGGLMLLMQLQERTSSQLLTDDELAEVQRFLAGRGWTLDQGVEFAKGIKCAEGLLQHFLRDE